MILLFILLAFSTAARLTENKITTFSFSQLLQSLNEEEAKQCKPFKHHENMSQCAYVKDSDGDCSEVQDGGFIDYLRIYFCSGGPRWLYSVLFAYLLFNVFIILGEVADLFFAPTMKEMSETLGLSETVSGVTFMALGNGAPDISASIDALTGSQPKLGMAALLGAAVFVPVVVTGVVALAVPGAQVARRPYIRDVLFLFFGVGYIVFIVFDHKITKAEAFSLWIFYALYVFIVFLGEYYRIQQEKRQEENADSQPKAISVLGLFSNESMANVYSVNGAKPLIESMANVYAQPRLNKVNSVGGGYAELDEDGEEDDPKTWYEWLYLIGTFPAQIVMQCCRLTCPTFEDFDSNGWNSKLSVLLTVTAPCFVVVAFQPLFQLTFKIGNQAFSAIWIVLLISSIPGAYVFYKVWSIANWKPQKLSKVYFLFLSFFSSVAWIYAIANELVNILSVLGVLLNISQSLLGLTVLAWGNSIGDLVANRSVAKKGKVAMAVSASFGGPLLNVLIGTGVSMTINTLNGKTDFPMSDHIIVCGFAVMGACVMHIIGVAFLSRFKLLPLFAYVSFVYYLAFMTTNIVVGIM